MGNVIKVGERIKELRKERGLTQSDVAVVLNVSREVVNMWENGGRDMKTGSVVALADFFNVTTDYLLGRSNAKTTNADMRSVCDLTGLSEEAVSCLLAFRKICKENVPSLKKLKEYFREDKPILQSSAFRYLVFLDNLIRHRSLLSIAHGTFEIIFESRNKRTKENIEQEFNAVLKTNPGIEKYLFSSHERIAYLEHRNAVHASTLSHDLCSLLLDEGYLGISADDIKNNYVRGDDFAET